MQLSGCPCKFQCCFGKEERESQLLSVLDDLAAMVACMDSWEGRCVAGTLHKNH